MIIPWSCHVCAKQFDKYAGGICSRCKKSTCLKHLKLVDYAAAEGPARPEQITCVNCVTTGESSTPLRRSSFSKIAWVRRLGL
jgi:hypothetical protein